jgi:hypothetical protein
MTNKLKKKCKTCIAAKQVAGCLCGCNETERVSRALDLVLRASHWETNPIEEQTQTMPRSLQSRRVPRKSIKLAQVRPRRSIAERALSASGRRDHPSHRVIGLPLDTTIPNIKNIRWHYCTRTDEQLAAQLGKSLLRLGICNAPDSSGSAVDFVERGFKRFCRANGADDARKIWDGELRITDCQFDSYGPHRGPFDPEHEPDSEVVYLVGEFNSSASVPIGPLLSRLGLENELLPRAFFEVFTENLYKWMRVYDYRDAVEQASCYMEDADVEDLKDSFYPQVEKNIPECLRIPANIGYKKAARFLADIQPSLQNQIGRQLIREMLTMDGHGKAHNHPWPGKLVAQVPGLEEYLSDTDGCCPGCAITWHEDDEISACFGPREGWSHSCGLAVPVGSARRDPPCSTSCCDLPDQVGWSVSVDNILLCFTATVLTFFNCRSPFLLCFEHVDNLGA